MISCSFSCLNISVFNEEGNLVMWQAFENITTRVWVKEPNVERQITKKNSEERNLECQMIYYILAPTYFFSVSKVQCFDHMGIRSTFYYKELNTVKLRYPDESGYRKVNLVNSLIFDIRTTFIRYPDRISNLGPISGHILPIFWYPDLDIQTYFSSDIE
jgi:hypothetical protein